MEKEARLLKNTLILLIGVVGTKLINFVMLPFYTDWLLVEEYGLIDIFSTVVALCVPVFTLQLEQAVFRFLIDDKTVREKQITISTGVFFMLLFLSGINFIAVVIAIACKNLLYMICMVPVCLQCCYVMIQQIIRGQGLNQIYTENSIILSIVNVFASIIFIRFFQLGVKGYILAFCLAHMTAIMFMLFKANIYHLIRWTCFSWELLKDLLCYAVPMILNNVSWWILNASDKLVLSVFLGIEANGIYAAAGKIPGLLVTFYAVFQMAWQEATSRAQDDEKEQFYTYVFRRLFALISYFAIVILLLGLEIFSILINEKFQEAYYHIPILVVALLFLCIAQFLGGICVGMKRSKDLAVSSIIAACINLTIDLSLINKCGIFAASLSTLIAYTVLCALRINLIRQTCILRYNIEEITLTFALVVIAFVLAYVTSMWMKLGALILISLLYYRMYRDIIFELIKKLKKRIKQNDRL